MTTKKQTQGQISYDDFLQALDTQVYALEKGQIVKGKIHSKTKDGYDVDIKGKSSGILPLNELTIDPSADLETEYSIGNELEFLVIKGQDAEGHVTLSRRQLELKQSWDDLVSLADTGKSVQLRVSGVNKGGVTGDIKGLRAFIPRSQLVGKMELDSLIGQLITATILEVNPDQNKLVLSEKQAVRFAAIQKVRLGTLMEGEITSLQTYGVFVDLDGVSGLLHVKQMSENPVASVPSLFKLGQRIKVMIAEVDEYKNRISLSTKVLENYPGELLEKMDEVMETAEERVAQARVKLGLE